MQFKTVEGNFRLRLQRRGSNNKWHAVGWPVQDELRYVIEQNPEIVKNLGDLFPLDELTDQQLANAGLNRDGDNVLSRFIEECERSSNLVTQLNEALDALEALDKYANGTIDDAGSQLRHQAEGIYNSPNHKVMAILQKTGRAWWDSGPPAESTVPDPPPTFAQDLERLINRHSMERGSGTPDFLLAEYLKSCLEVYDKTLQARARWYDDRIPNGAGGAVPPDGEYFVTNGP